MNMDLICFCHLRWHFVYQRPQHLISRFAKHQRVFVVEEAIFDAVDSYNEIYHEAESNLWIVTPHLTNHLAIDQIHKAQRNLLDLFIDSMNINKYMLLYYSPMALSSSNHLTPELIIYDCMDELSAFKFAPPSLKKNEAMLFQKADIVFTGGNYLYEAKKDFHSNIYALPSSIDKEHFAIARKKSNEPEDQKDIPHPRIGFYGVVDERFDIELLTELASQKPLWNFVIIGPVVKIDESVLPKNKNIYYLGSKDYKELPQYISSWDIAMLPFALNESTKFISPTKTPEYLAAGKPVISTSIRDVIKPYGENKLVYIADTSKDFIKAAETILSQKKQDEWLLKVDTFLKDMSWDNTWAYMNGLIQLTLSRKTIFKTKKPEAYV